MKYNLKTLWDVIAQITIILTNEENLSSGSKEILNNCLNNLNCLLSQQCRATTKQLKFIENNFPDYLKNIINKIDNSNLSEEKKSKLRAYSALVYLEQAYEIILPK